MSEIPKAHWIPADGKDLEQAARDALFHEGNVSVFAGPGSGKTEFLAQKAFYLMERNLCRPPFKILAISYKRESARNLQERVHQRIGARDPRFLSLTFDSFFWRFLHQFHAALPPDWQVAVDIEILPSNDLMFSAFRNFFYNKGKTHNLGSGPFSRKDLESLLRKIELPLSIDDPTEYVPRVAHIWFTYLQTSLTRPFLTHQLIAKLSELILRRNPHILTALRSTYRFVFVDEFQDTNEDQYRFLRTAFQHSTAQVTVVGDEKQRIMGFAGAMDNAAPTYKHDFGAQEYYLTYNYRSSPEVVRVLNFVTQAIDKNMPETVSKTPSQVTADAAQHWQSDHISTENLHLAKWILRDMKTRGKKPDDYVVLARQKAGDLYKDLLPVFVGEGIPVSDETREYHGFPLQTLRSEELVKFVLSLFRLAADVQSSTAWNTVETAYWNMYEVQEEGPASRDVAAKFLGLVQKLREIARHGIPDADTINLMLGTFDREIERSRLYRIQQDYGDSRRLDSLYSAYKQMLLESVRTGDSWHQWSDRVEGIGILPLMSIHKSKGLEYDTVIIMGFDEESWWAHRAGTNEDGKTYLFVALSRAKQRILLLSCQERGFTTGIKYLEELIMGAGFEQVYLREPQYENELQGSDHVLANDEDWEDTFPQ